jgi:hypothetical protein
MMMVLLMFVYFVGDKCASEKTACCPEQASTYLPQPFITLSWRSYYLIGREE